MAVVGGDMKRLGLVRKDAPDWVGGDRLDG